MKLETLVEAPVEAAEAPEAKATPNLGLIHYCIFTNAINMSLHQYEQSNEESWCPQHVEYCGMIAVGLSCLEDFVSDTRAFFCYSNPNILQCLFATSHFFCLRTEADKSASARLSATCRFFAHVRNPSSLL